MSERPKPQRSKATDPPAAGFEETSGETGIPAFGIEASERMRYAAQAALTDYLQAVEEGKWAEACTHLVRTTRVDLLRLIARLDQAKEKTCPEGLRIVRTQIFREGRGYTGPADIAALRIEQGGPAGEAAGFALFHGNDGKDYWITMRLEDREWKVLASNPVVLE